MVVEAISGVDNKGLAPLSFEGKKHKSENAQVVTSPLKAVPLAVLIAMSPLVETNAKNIMSSEPVQTPTEVVQNQVKENIIYAKSFKTTNFPKVDVLAVNTKENLDGFDKIKIKIDGETFEVKDVSEIEAYLLSSNGVKEGPMLFKQVLATYEKNSETYSFIDNNLTNYVAAIITQGKNNSNIKSIERKKFYLTPDIEDGVILCNKFDHPYVSSFLNDYEPKTTNFGTPIPSLTKDVQGTFGQYKLRFYKKNSSNRNFNVMTIQKNGEKEFLTYGMEIIKTQIVGLDTNLDAGNAMVLSLDSKNNDSCISDDELCNTVLDILNKDENIKNNLSFFIENTSSNLWFTKALQY